jgi:hypothetical protein
VWNDYGLIDGLPFLSLIDTQYATIDAIKASYMWRVPKGFHQSGTLEGQ